MITKQEALDKIEELKKLVAGEEKKEVKGVKILNINGDVIYESKKTTIKEVVEEAVSGGAYLRDAYLRDAYLRDAYLGGADLIGANLRDAYLGGAELMYAKFSGIGGTTRIKKSQVDDFMKALGIIVDND
jgi:hypothetical protein